MKNTISEIQVKIAILEQLAERAPYSVLTSMGFASISAVFLAYSAPFMEVAIWWLAISFCCIPPILYVLARRSHPFDEDNAHRYRQIHFLNSGLSGLTWGVGIAILTDPSSEYALTASFLLLACYSIGAIIVMGELFGSYLVVAAGTLAPYGLSLLIRANPHSLIFAAGSFALLLFLSFVVKKFSQRSRRRIETQMENRLFLEQLRQQKDAIQRVNEYKSNFLAATSHDMAQPLDAQGNFIASLGRLLVTSEQREVLAKIEDSWRSLKSLLDGLTDISSIDAATIMPHRTDVELSGLIKMLVDENSIAARRKNLVIDTDVEYCVVNTDATLLARILRNILSNAVKFTPPRGQIDIRVDHPGDHPVVKISDTGIGVSADKHMAIFEDYVQLGNPGRRRDKGLGLGLSIVKSLCELLDIEMEFKSAPGAGTQFTLRLPKSDAETSVPANNATDHAPLRKCLLVICPEKTKCDAMSRVLSEWQCEVYCACHIEEALQVIGATGAVPDIAIIRPGADEEGHAAVKRLREATFRCIPVIVLTEADDRQTMPLERALVLREPLSNAMLHHALTTSLSATELAAE